jgi:trans-AT polyketide synthase/acyltransferase/oxidoreductase domain-containing protein
MPINSVVSERNGANAVGGSESPGGILPEQLGSADFRRDYGIRFAYLSGSMYKAISSKELVIAMGRAGLMGYLGTGGIDLAVNEASITQIQAALAPGAAYGVNLLADLANPEAEDQTVDLFLRRNVRCVEASAFTKVSPAIVRYRLAGVERLPNGEAHTPNRVLAKVSHPEVAESFMRPAAPTLLRKLVEAGRISEEQALLGERVPVAQDVCVEADSGGHTDRRVANVLLPAILNLRERISREVKYAQSIRVGAAGGIGTPEAVAAAFVVGADFVMTGSINQCTVEAGTSDAVKDMLQSMGVQDTDYAPAGDMFELGAKVQVLKKGLLFPARANKLYELYLRHNSLDEIDPKTRAQIEDSYFKRSIDEVWAETRAYLSKRMPQALVETERNPKRKMAAIFRWYFVHSTRLAMTGSDQQKVDYQVHCGPALGAFNAWVKGTDIEAWQQRHAPDIAQRLMTATANLLNHRFNRWTAAAVA